MSAAAEIIADRLIERTRRISEALCDVEAVVRDSVDAALTRLADEGCYRVNRGWSRSEEDKLIREAAALAAVQAIMASDWVDLPGEVLLIHGGMQK